MAPNESHCLELLNKYSHKDPIQCTSAEETSSNFNRIKKIFNDLAIPKPAPLVISVAGTNGKGSIAKFLQEMYCAAHYKVAAFYSPHIYQLNERIFCNTGYISYTDMYHNLKVIINRLDNHIPVSFFLLLLLTALCYFCQQHLDIVILEVGLGGRFDAVNLIDADVAVIGHIALDHTHILGDNIEAIAYQKAGIMRPHKPVVICDNHVCESLLKYAHDIKAKPYWYKKNFDFTDFSTSWDYISDSNRYTQLPKPKLDIINAANAIAVCEHLQHLLPVSEDALRYAIHSAELPGRFEKLAQDPLIIADMAHNPNSITQFKKKLQASHITGKIYAIFTMAGDKDCLSCLKILGEFVDYFYLTEVPDNERMLSIDNLCEFAQQANIENYEALTMSQALACYRSKCSSSDCCIIVGSSYLLNSIKPLI